MLRVISLLILAVSYAQAITYTIAGTGPHHVVVGHNMYFNINGTVTVGPDESVIPTVSGLPAGVTTNWINQTKPGGCCGPTAPGVAGLNPLVITVPSNTTTGTYPLTITYTTISNVVRTATWNLIVDPVPGALTTQTFPANTALTGLATWQSNMTSAAATFCPGGVPSGPAFEGFVWYYDGVRNYYQIADYTSNTQWLTCARNLGQAYQDYVLQVPPTWTGTAGNIPGWHVFPKGMAMRYTREGIQTAKTAILAMQSQGYASPTNIAGILDFLLSREMSYAVETNLEAEGIGVARNSTFQLDADILIGIMDQWFQSQNTVYTQPFMVALACEALIQYYDATGDPRVPPLIKLAADQLYSVSWDILSNSFMYYNSLNGVGGGPSAPYDTQCSNYASFSVTCKGPSPDLNMLILPIYGWVFQHTGDVTYRNIGDILFNTGVTNACISCDGKHFSQNYRWSAQYVTWRQTPSQAPPNSVIISDKSGTTQTNRPFTVSRVFAKGEIPNAPQVSIGGSTVTTQADIKTRWSDGSVQHAMVSFLATVPANGSITALFVNQAAGLNGTPLTRAQMLAASWGASIEATNGSVQSASARQIITDWSGSTSDTRVRYWLQGAVCTQVIVEDRTSALQYDMGWDTFKPLHPIFVVTFYPSTPTSVEVEMILENMWTTKLEDQTYSLALKTGLTLSTTVYTKPSFTHPARTRWHKVFWSGITPGAINIDYNLAYMAYSQALPNFDQSQPSASSGDISAFNASDKGDIGGHAMVLQAMPTTGGRPDIGNFPGWFARHMHTFDPAGGLAMVTGLADVESYVPIHMRESATNRFYDSGHTINAFGYQWSLDARPAAPAAPDSITAVGTTSNGGWAYDIAHEPDLVYYPYLLTGRWYYLEEMYFMAQTAIQVSPPGFCIWCRGDSLGYMSYNNQMRGQAWGLRDLTNAAFMAPDATPEKAYFTQKLNNNIEIEEGHYNITNGSFPPSNSVCPGYVPSDTASKWCYGRLIAAMNPDKNTVLHNPLFFQSWGNASTGCGETHVTPAGIPADQCINSNSPWQNGFWLAEMGFTQERGFAIGPLNQTAFKFLLHMIQDPSFNPYLVGTYVMPTIRNSTNDYYVNWADVLGGFSTAWSCNGVTYNLQTYQGWAENCAASGSGDSNVGSPGYPHIMQGAASYLVGLNINDGALTGLGAWNWMLSHVGFQTSFGVNPQWAILPRVVQPGTSTCDLNNDNVVNILDVQLSINSVLGLATCGKGDLDGDGRCTVIDVQRIVVAALGGSCRLGP